MPGGGGGGGAGGGIGIDLRMKTVEAFLGLSALKPGRFGVFDVLNE
jgi:hypothetical protein